ncbi:MAG: T9SS type A sorting domain-containing protein [candidate division Zixibacteria bacterium]|nr:T9SS type A sorting domain-containing protein [candidate division Zixibacteria bacterium]
MRFCILVISIILFLASVLYAQPYPFVRANQHDILPVTAHIPDTNFTLMSYALPNNPKCELIYDDHLYLGAGTTLRIYELGEDGIPVLTGQAITRGLIHELEHDGQYLYIANSQSGIAIYEGDNFENPSELSRYQTEYAALRICVSGDSLYYIAYQGMGILNIQDRTNPVLEREVQQDSIGFNDAYYQNDIYILDNYLLSLITHRNPSPKKYLGIFDLNSPDSIPCLVDSIYISNITQIGHFKLIDDIIYMCTMDSLAIYRFNPAPHPEHLSTVPHDGGYSGFDVEYIDESRIGFWGGCNQYPDGDSAYTEIYEILLDDLSNPQILDTSFIVPHAGYLDLIQHNGYSYGIGYHGWYYDGFNPGLYVHKWGDGAGGELIHHEMQYSFCNSVAAKDDVAYAGTYWENLTILDMLDKTNPQVVGEIPGFTYVVQMKIIDDKLYILTPSKLTIFDISEPFSPVELGRLYLRASGNGINFHIHDNLVYINYWWISPQMYGCLLIADISDPSNMTVYHDTDLYGSPNPSHLNYPNLFLLSYHGSMKIYDVSDSTNPTLYCVEDMNLGSGACYSRDTLLYMFGACYQLWDISDLRYPDITGHWEISSRYDDVQFYDGKLFMADFTTGFDVLVWDIDASPLEPYHVGYFSRFVNGFMSIDLPYVYVPGGEYGLITIRFDDPTGIKDDKPPLPEGTELLTAYPNPFNSTINFSINIGSSDIGELKIYNVAGRLVKSIDIPDKKMLSPVTWDGTNADGVDVSTGVYFAKYEDVNCSQTQKIILLK